MAPLHALITGGSRGIGLATARLFAQNGYRCTLLSRSEDALKTAVASLAPLQIPKDDSSKEEAVGNYEHGYVVGSVGSGSGFWSTTSSREGGKDGEEEMTRSFGTYLPKPQKHQPSHPSVLDVLVNCAGISQASLFTTTLDANIEAILNTNLTGLMLSTRFLLRQGYLRRRSSSKIPSPPSPSTLLTARTDPGPAIINISSLLGLKGGYGAVAYSAAKAGLLGFTRALATEYASHGVRVNAVVPGYVETGMTGELNQTELEKQIPLARFGTPDEIAHAVLFLAQNAYAHNCVVNLDGGLSAV